LLSVETKWPDLHQATAGAFAAWTIASSSLLLPTLPADAAVGMDTFVTTAPSTLLSEKFVREGLYGDYEVDLVQTYDDARSTFKPAKETKAKKGKYTAILAILIVGSFIVPMAQVRDK
jgi:hypothetical protein